MAVSQQPLSHALAALCLLLGCWLNTSPALAQTTTDTQPPAPVIWHLPLQGVIGPASSDLLIRTLDNAEQQNVHLLIISLDTPGGLMTSMRTMIHRMLAARVPILTWVHPKGARAASAGTFLMYASHLTAMSAATNLGAATPIQMGMPARPGSPQGDRPGDNTPQSALEKKVINDAVAYIRSLAALYGRNAQWAEQAVREGASLDANAALANAVIEILASDIDDLIRQADGRTLQVNEQPYLLQLAGMARIELALDWRYAFLSTITNPNVAYILMLIGFYGLLLEFYNPGVGVPGIIGSISLLTALYALQLLPINYAGLALLLLALGLMITEALSPSVGIFGFGGLAAFVLGSILLMDTELPDFQLAVPLIAAFRVTSLLVCIVLLSMALRSRKTPMASGTHLLIGQSGVAISAIQPAGRVQLKGEIWFARSTQPIAKGQTVIIDRINGLTLDVHAASSDREFP